MASVKPILRRVQQADAALSVRQRLSLRRDRQVAV